MDGPFISLLITNNITIKSKFMNKSFFIIALSLGMVACSSDATSEEGAGTEVTTDTGAEDNGKEIDRLVNERDELLNKHIEALENGNLDEANIFKAQMDSVDAIYQEL